MKTKIITFAAFILGSALTVVAQSEKTVEKSFSATTLAITNSFGDVNITTHGGSNIEMTVVITVNNEKPADAAKQLNDINIQVKEAGGRVDVITKNEVKQTKGCNSFRIDYSVKMPESTNLIVKNSFGNTTIASVKGNLDVKQQHGDCYVGSVTGATNKIKVMFGRFNGALITNADVDVQHGNSTLSKLKNVNFKQQFGTLKVTEIEGELRVNASHGAFKVETVLPGLTLLDVTSQFGAVELSNVPKEGYRIDLDGSFTSFKYASTFTVIETEKDITSESHSLQSKGGGEKLIKINASHGSVKVY
jgi:hypothetical protein